MREMERERGWRGERRNVEREGREKTGFWRLGVGFRIGDSTELKRRRDGAIEDILPLEAFMKEERMILHLRRSAITQPS